MRATKTVPTWLEGVRLLGFDDDDGAGDGSGDGDEPGEEDEDGDEGADGEQNTDGLKSALRKERKARRAAEKQARALQKANEDKTQQEADDLTRVTSERDKERQKAERLAARVATQAVDSEIMRQAVSMQFIDPSDALSLVDRDIIEVDQDDDDPASVTVDRDSVKEALNDLKKARPHLLVAEGDNQPSGGKFGGRRDRQDGKETDAQRRDREMGQYSALRHRRSTSS